MNRPQRRSHDKAFPEEVKVELQELTDEIYVGGDSGASCFNVPKREVIKINDFLPVLS